MKTFIYTSVIILIVILFGLGYSVGVYMTEERIKIGLYEGQGIRVQLEVYKNGELVYVDYDDPATYNFLKLVAELIAGDVVGGMTNTSGSTINGVSSGTAGDAQIFLNYDQNYIYSFNLTSLPTSYDIATVPSSNVVFDDTTKSFQLSTSITVSASGTLYGVGLVSSFGPLVVFYDELSTPITVNANDVVTVVYKITLP